MSPLEKLRLECRLHWLFGLSPFHPKCEKPLKVPLMRGAKLDTNNLGWLRRNLGIDQQDNENLTEALQIVKELSRANQH